MIHGYPNWAIDTAFDFIHQNDDWTDGCIAVTNKEIEEIVARENVLREEIAKIIAEIEG